MPSALGQVTNRKPYCINGTATTTLAAVDVGFQSAALAAADTASVGSYAPAAWFSILNLDGTNDVRVRFENSVSAAYRTVRPGASFAMDATVRQIYVQSSAGTAAFEVVATANFFRE
jgi:hypothetical protein